MGREIDFRDAANLHAGQANRRAASLNRDAQTNVGKDRREHQYPNASRATRPRGWRRATLLRDIVAHVMEADTATPLDDRARDGVRVWTGRVPASGTFRIDIVREARGGDPVLTYALSVSLR